MQIPFRKVLTHENSLNFENERLCFRGSIEKTSTHEVLLKGTLEAKCELSCNRCADDFSVTICEDLQLRLSDTALSVEDLDTIECLDGIVDIEKILQSELEIFKNDYNYCNGCDSSQEFEIEY
ncbi:MAG: hypothetical protein ACQESH_03995 [Campylobacterota bacterium]